MISEAIERYGLPPISGEALEKLEAFLELLLFWNSRQNLTAIRDARTIIERHFVESIFCALKISPAATVLDFGSGAGFPGIPTAIVRPDLQVTLAESQGKKAAFLREAVRKLGLTTKVHSGRVEALPAEMTFDCVTMRAVDKMLEALPMAWARVKASGCLIIFSTSTSREPIRNAIPEGAWTMVSVPGQLADGLLLQAKR